jgi:hypothetical protein
MKNLLLVFLLIGNAALAQNDEALVKEVVNSAYVSGIQNGGAIADIRKGFHPTFQMLRFMENDVKPMGIEEWITAIEKNRAQATAPHQRCAPKANTLV